MCGIIGYSGKNNINEADLKILLFFAEERGDHSCGIATRSQIIKEAISPLDFIKKELPTDKLVLGHTRAATTGAKTDRNAHPFENEDLVGIHNGVIRNFTQLQREEDTKFQVDSEIIWHLINKYGIEEAMKKMTGWMALAWKDEEERLNLYRYAGPMYVGYKDSGLYFGSEEYYLESIDCEEIEELESRHHYIIEDGEIISKEKIKNMPFAGTNRASNQKKDKSKQNPSINGAFYDRFDAPEDADYVLGHDSVVYYYWFSPFNTYNLMIQPSYSGTTYRPQVQSFQLDVEKDVDKLKSHYTDVYLITKVKDKIKKIYDNE